MTDDLVGRDRHEVEALVVDRYLDAILAAHGRGADHGPVADPLDPVARATIARLVRDLPRPHPSFRFEEALAARLADVAAALRVPAAAGGEASIIPWRVPSDPTVFGVDPGVVDPTPGLEGDRDLVGPLILGGVASAALSLAGAAAWIAWRRLERPSSTPMARAVRTIARTRSRRGLA